MKDLNVEAVEDGAVLVPEGLLSRKFATSSGEPGVRPIHSVIKACSVLRLKRLALSLFLQVAYLSAEGNPLWFSIGKGNDALIPSGEP